jgi:uncharacterized protein (TIGR02996 family)
VDDSSFLRAILEDPASDLPRLVWADRLDERGDPRGEFVRVQCELARWPCECDTSEERIYHNECRCKEMGELQRRERKLLREYWWQWNPVAIPYPSTCANFGRPPVPAPAVTVEFRRGLVGSVTLTAAQFFGGPCEKCGGLGQMLPALERPSRRKCRACRGTGRVEGLAAALFRAAPITEVRLSDKRPLAVTGSQNYVRWWDGLMHDGPDYIPNVLWRIIVNDPEDKCCITRLYDTEADALSALSDACVAYGRSLTHPPLPPLTGVPATESKR